MTPKAPINTKGVPCSLATGKILPHLPPPQTHACISRQHFSEGTHIYSGMYTHIRTYIAPFPGPENEATHIHTQVVVITGVVLYQ